MPACVWSGDEMQADELGEEIPFEQFVHSTGW